MPKVLSPLDMSGLEIRNFQPQSVVSLPSNPFPGQLVRLTSGTPGLYYHDGTDWLMLSTGGGTSAPSGPAGGDLTGTYPNPAIAAGAVSDAQVSDAAGIQLSKLATDPLARANHTGTQPASTISDLAAILQATRLDQFAAPTTALSAGGQRVTNAATPNASSDLVTKGYADGLAAGLAVKDPVRAAATTNLTLSGTQTVDGVALAAGDRVLVAGQTDPAGNGIYTVASGGWARTSDADTAGEIKPGTLAYVQEGAAAGSQQWVCGNVDATPWQPDSSGSTWMLYFAVTPAQAGAGLTGSGSVLAVGAGAGITVGSDQVAVDTATVTRKAVATITGDGATTAFTVTHGLNAAAPAVTVRDSGGARIWVDDTAGSAGQVTITFAVAPATGTTYSVRVDA